MILAAPESATRTKLDEYLSALTQAQSVYWCLNSSFPTSTELSTAQTSTEFITSLDNREVLDTLYLKGLSSDDARNSAAVDQDAPRPERWMKGRRVRSPRFLAQGGAGGEGC